MYKLLAIFSTVLIVTHSLPSYAQFDNSIVPDEVMLQTYHEIKTPHKYGLVLTPSDNNLAFDSPSVFKKGSKWYMIYIAYDGRGYETWIAQSKDLLRWKTLGRVMSFTDSSLWDDNQRAGYAALEQYQWGGKYKLQRYQGKYWMSYLGGNTKGYEAGVLSIGMANTKKNPATAHEWDRLPKPILTIHDQDRSWWDNVTLYKSQVIWDKAKTLGYPFVMYYNAKGPDTVTTTRQTERIGMAVSDDMIHWKRYLKDPVLDHQHGITGDAYIQKIGDLWVMFYFGAWWGPYKGAFNRFACSYDMVNWTDWKGENLIEPSEPYDDQYAHKTSIVKHKGVVYHFYCATNKFNQRGIAVATSKDIGESTTHFIAPPATEKK